MAVTVKIVVSWEVVPCSFGR